MMYRLGTCNVPQTGIGSGIKTGILGLVLLVLAAMPSQGRAESLETDGCESPSLTISQVLGQTYDPAALSSQLVQLSVNSGRRSLDCVPTAIIIQPRHGAGQITLSGPGEPLPWRAVASGQMRQAASNRIELSAAARRQLAEQGRLELDLLEIDAGQFRMAGDYLAALEWSIDDQPAQPFDVQVTVVPAIRFVGDTTQRMALGDVTEGGHGQARFMFSTNADIKVTVRSTHQGYLQHEQGRSFGRIPYSASLTGRSLDLSVPGTVDLVTSRTGLNTGQLDVRVEPQGGQYAGRYHDTLTLEFIPY